MTVKQISLGETSAVASELNQLLAGHRLQRVVERAGGDLVLVLRGRGRTSNLLLSWRQPFQRIHLCDDRAGHGKHPSALCMALRKHLVGARIKRIRKLGRDRVVCSDYELGGSSGSLILQLIPARCGLALVDSEGVISHASGPSLPPPGRIYEPPPPPGGLPDGERPDSRPDDRPDDRDGPLPTTGDPTPKELQDGEQDDRDEEGGPGGGGGRPWGELSRDGGIDTPASDRISQRLGLAAAREDRLGGARAELRRLRKELKRHQRLEANLTRDLSRCEHTAEGSVLAELLKGNLHAVRKGMTSVLVDDWSSPGEQVEIPLDPKLDPVGNMEALFSRARRGKRGMGKVRERLVECRGRLEECRAQLARADAELERAGRDEPNGPAGGPGEPPVGPTAPPLVGRKQTPGRVKLPYRTFQAAGGDRILVGRNAAGNGQLSFRMARGSDLWLHARDYPGPHVLVRLGRGASADSELFLDAATLAAWFSSARKSGVVEVSHTRAANVRKPRRGKPGQALVSKEKSVAVRIDEGRVRRLLDSEE